MPINPPILAAISGALQAYLADEEASQAAAAMAGAAGAPGPPLNLWALSGRSRPCSCGCWPSAGV